MYLENAYLHMYCANPLAYIAIMPYLFLTNISTFHAITIMLNHSIITDFGIIHYY